MTTIRSRREPPPFRPATVVDVVDRSDRLVRLTLAGPALAGLDIGLPAASVRLLVPDDPSRPADLPIWNGNEFLRSDGTRPTIRTLTPVRFDLTAAALEVEIVLHGDGPLSAWASARPLGSSTAVSGTGRGYTVDPAASSFLLAGDESAIPALSVLLGAIAPTATIVVLIEAAEPVIPASLPHHPGATVSWLGRAPGARPGDALGAAIATLDLDPDIRVWAAGEAAGVHRLRQHLFDERGIPRSRAVVRGYWKIGRGGEDTDSG